MSITCIVNDCNHENGLDREFEGDAVIETERCHFEDVDQIEVECSEHAKGKSVDPIEVVVELFDTYDASY